MTNKKKVKLSKTRNQKKLDKLLKSHKVEYLWVVRITSVCSFFFLSCLIVGNHSTYLIKPFLKVLAAILLVVSILLFFCFFVLYIVKEKDIKLGKRSWWLNSLTIFICSAAIAILALLYGGNTQFKEWLITTAMSTMNHQYLCKIFYNQREIDEALSKNYLIEPDQVYDDSLINVVSNTKEKEFKYDPDNEYEVKMFKNHTNDEIYRLIQFEVNGENAYLAIVYDPSNIQVVVSKYALNSGEYVIDMAKRTNALIAVNGGRFIDPNWSSAGGNPEGVTIEAGRIITDYPYGDEMGVIGFSEDNKLGLYKDKSALELKDMGIRDCITSQPFLIVNGEAAFTKGNGGYGLAARTAVGQREDGVTLILVVDSNETRTNGAGMKDLTEIFQNYGCINAAALDGGTSTSMVEKGVMISHPINGSLKPITRPVATGLIVKDMKKEA